MAKKILLLGATGSIGQQTIDVIRQHPDQFILTGVSAGHQADRLQQIIDENPGVTWAGISADKPIEAEHVYTGPDQMVELVKNADYDVLVNAVVGFQGLAPTLACIERGKDLALANKESLVAGGPLVKEALKHSPTTLTPIDSEHSAIFQCLQGADDRDVRRLIITASGGSFRDRSRAELQDVTVEQALSHPNWSMGPRITIDSATMVNKGFEVIEAHYLFDIPFENIATVLHRESLVHSLVEFQDNAILAQLGSADMRVPIQYALTVPQRPALCEDKPLDMTKTLSLSFQEMDFERYPMLKLAYEAGQKGGNAGAVFNAADEQAVQEFLAGRIGFLDIEKAIAAALETISFIEKPTFAELKESDEQTRAFVKALSASSQTGFGPGAVE